MEVRGGLRRRERGEGGRGIWTEVEGNEELGGSEGVREKVKSVSIPNTGP